MLRNLTTTLALRAFGLIKIPLFAFTSPTVVEMNEKRLVLKIPLNYRTRNHLGVMYFGALNIGAEASVGVMAFEMIRASGEKIDFLFKDYKVRFLKRADGDVHFICDHAQAVQKLITQARTSEERLNATIPGYAIVPTRSKVDHVAEFEVTLTVKRRSHHSAKAANG